MSDLKAKQTGIRFVPVATYPRSRPYLWHLFQGVLFPAFVIGFEAIWHLCGEAFFDPMPTPLHFAAISAVPAANLAVWSHLRYGVPGNSRWLAFASGVSIAVAALYTALFLPLMPIAVVAMVAMGIGLLPFGPVLSLMTALRLRVLYARRYDTAPASRPMWAGFAAGLLLLLALDVPSAATRLGVQWAASEDAATRQRGVLLLRYTGDPNYLLRLCYDASGRAPGLLSILVDAVAYGYSFAPARTFSVPPAEAREIYYRVYGEPFNVRPAPYTRRQWSRFDDFAFDADLGGAVVGGRIKGLSLASSRLDGSINSSDAVAYLEWVMEFRNASAVPREARAEILMPPGGVVSRATLWVNGEEREAAYGGRGEVRAAYQKVAVQQQRDPLLVTTKGADRALAQAFPVAPGGTIKFKIGITAPLDFDHAGQVHLTLPAIAGRNFSFGPSGMHSVWIESKTALAIAAPPLVPARIQDGLYRVTGTINDRDLSALRPVVTAARDADAGARVARLAAGEVIHQDVSPSAAPKAMMLLIDGSARLGGTRGAIIKALDAIPDGVKVGAMLAGEPVARVTFAAWSPEQKRAVTRLVEGAAFTGGQDNGPALADALVALEAEPDGLLFWVHGPQPVAFTGAAARLEQATARLQRLPQVTLYSVEPGPNETLPDAAWAWAARLLPRTGPVDADLAAYFTRTFGPDRPLAARRTVAQPGNGLPAGSEHIARLWAAGRVLELMRENADANRSAAVGLAARYHLVTPVSGAVVLETKAQYDDARLTPAGQSSVPTVPEPHEWALLAVAALALLWLVWRHRQSSAGAA